MRICIFISGLKGLKCVSEQIKIILWHDSLYRAAPLLKVDCCLPLQTLAIESPPLLGLDLKHCLYPREDSLKMHGSLSFELGI